jgi:hypothetical protein
LPLSYYQLFLRERETTVISKHINKLATIREESQFDSLEDFLESELIFASGLIGDIENLLSSVQNEEVAEKIESSINQIKECIDTIKVTMDLGI